MRDRTAGIGKYATFPKQLNIFQSFNKGAFPTLERL
jgi:hypothetical protein